jgi:hypothetical protein
MNSSFSTLLLTAAYDQLAAAFDQLRMQIALCDETVVSSDQRAQLTKAWSAMETGLDTIQAMLPSA